MRPSRGYVIRQTHIRERWLLTLGLIVGLVAALTACSFDAATAQSNEHLSSDAAGDRFSDEKRG